VRGDPFRLGPRVAEETGRARMPDASLMRCDRLVDGGAKKWVDEPERRLRAQDVDPCERPRCLGSSLSVQLCQRRCVVGIGVVAEDRDSLRKPP
jgi:hypothetical protein